MIGALLSAVLFGTAASPPPRVLAPYIHAERFDAGDYRWMRGRFDDAGPADKADWRAVQTWLTTCAALRRQSVVAELGQMGVARPVLADTPLTWPLCAQVSFATPDLPVASFAAFEADLRVAKPIAATHLFAVANADEVATPPDGTSLADRLLLRPMSEQVLRFALGWGQGEHSAPALTPGQRAIVLAAVTVATERADRANTAWLKAEVAARGWPSLSRVGERASRAAWLLVQHADADPAFQLRVLRLMAPLDAAHDLPSGNYAYLYDRVMLKLAGKQRYGTQMTCAAGTRVPLPLEDGRVADWRRQAGMQPLADYMVTMDQFGRCPPAPVGARTPTG